MFLVHGEYNPTLQMLIDLSSRYAVALDLLLKSRIAGFYQVVRADPAIDFNDYRRVHTNSYVDVLAQIHASGVSTMGIPPEGVQFERVGVGGTLTATHLALESKGFAYHIGGGYHHGMPDGPYSIDYSNDVAIALALILESGASRILYVDLDAHHPNGVQKIFGGEKRILQISLHEWPGGEEGNFTYIGVGEGRGKKINMPIPSHSGDAVYLQVLSAILSSVVRQYNPEVVFYQAGVDSYRNDPIGSLNISLNGLYKRDLLVASTFMKIGRPFIGVLGGGYHPVAGPRAIVNTLAAFAGQDIVFDETESSGSPVAVKTLRWYDSLRLLLRPYILLDAVNSIREDTHA